MDNNITEYMTRRHEHIMGSMLRREDFEEKLKELKNSAGPERFSIVSELIDMFGLLHIECESDMENEYYEALVKNSELPDISDVVKHMINVMYENFEYYPSPEDYMKRIVDRCCNPADGWNNDTLRLRILKQYIKYGNFPSYRIPDPKKPGKMKSVAVFVGKRSIENYVKNKTGNKGGLSADELIKGLDDGVFDLLKSESSCGMLKVCDELSRGLFVKDRGIKRELYYFAMIFNMTWTPKTGMTGQDVDSEKDIEKNLFTDYYNNNVMRFIFDEYDIDDEMLKKKYELDFAGYGINYKNFAEMVYIYYIAKEGYSPGEKIAKAEEMIYRLRKSAPEKKSAEKYIKKQTYIYECNFAEKNALNMPEDEFERFIAENYQCGEGGIKSMTDHNTAAEVFRFLISGIDDLNNCNMGIGFTELEKSDEKLTGNLKSYIDDNDSEKLNRFINLIYGIDRYLNDTEKLAAADPSSVTRTVLVTAYYYYYMAGEFDKNVKVKSFADIYRDFTNTRTGLNFYLEKAGYQPVSEKNIFDTAVMFGEYRAVNVNLKDKIKNAYNIYKHYKDVCQEKNDIIQQCRNMRKK